MGVLIIAVACLLSSACYRWGGRGGFKNAKLIRRLGCSLVFTIMIALLFHPTNIISWLCLIVSMGLSYGALTTYLDNIFGYDNFWAAGFLCGIAGLPLLVFIPWWIVALRLIINTVGQGLVSKLSGNDNVEEFSRGAFFIL
jgi:hypothetical protein